VQHQVGEEGHNWELVSGDPTKELETAQQRKKKLLKKKSGEWDVERKGGEERAVKDEQRNNSTRTHDLSLKSDI